MVDVCYDADERSDQIEKKNVLVAEELSAISVREWAIGKRRLLAEI